MKKKSYSFFSPPAIFRLTLAFVISLATAFSPAFSAANSQDLSKVKCSIQFNQQPLQKVFDNIRAQTSFEIVCVNQNGFLSKPVSIDAQNSNLAAVLDLLAGKVAFTYTTLNNKIIVKPAGTKLNRTNTVAPPVTISGRVTDSKNKALPGVSVMVKGTTTGTVTNEEGKFSIKASSGDVLVFRHTGFTGQEITVSGQHEYTVMLEEEIKGLSEVVVTALGIRKEKAKLGYAAQEVNGEDIKKAREPNVISNLTGRVAGLDIRNTTDLFQNPTMTLRGRRPLIVIDGIPDQSNDIWKLNADDIEDMTVLKGASASALYGSIGQNGAIMITTKRGKGKDLNIELNSTTEFQLGFLRIPDVQTLYGDGMKGKYAYIDGTGAGTEGAGWVWGPRLDKPDPTTPSGFFETPQYDSPIDPATGKRIPTPFISRGADNVKNFFSTGVISTNNVSITKSLDKGSFRFSAGNVYQLGIMPNADLNNTSFSVAGNYDLSNKLSADARISYNKQFTNNFPVVGYGSGDYLYNLILWTGPDVDILDLKNYWQPGKEGYNQRNYNYSYYNNPYFVVNEYLQGYDKSNTFGSLNLNYKISPAFNIRLRNGFNAYNLFRPTSEPKSYLAGGQVSKGNFTAAYGNYFDITSDLIADYNHTFSDQIKLHVQAGGSNYYRNEKSGNAKTDGLNVPGLYNLGNSINPVTATNTQEERRTSSIYGVVDLELLNAVYITATGRNDFISTLPVKNNSFFYPSFGSSVILSRLMKMPQWVSLLKARGSWSQVSSGTLNDNAYTYGYLPTFSRGTIWNNQPSLTYGASILNPNLRPQTSNSWEVGVDAKFLKNRIGFEATYFQTRDFNNIYSFPISTASGFSTQTVNGNEFKRKGFELTLTGSPFRTEKGFSWDVMANFSIYHRYLTKIYGNAPTLNNLRVGDRTDKLFVNKYQTDPQGNIVYNTNGLPLAGSFPRLVGYGDPRFFYGLENTFTYHGVSLRFLVDGRVGGVMFSQTNQRMWAGGTHKGTINQYREDASNGLNNYTGEGVIVT
ncbi:MAG: SusC/RagA family TonB-linked outer membrane protein, partial [Chitinophagaceae bacterium]